MNFFFKFSCLEIYNVILWVVMVLVIWLFKDEIGTVVNIVSQVTWVDSWDQVYNVRYSRQIVASWSGFKVKGQLFTKVQVFTLLWVNVYVRLVKCYHLAVSNFKPCFLVKKIIMANFADWVVTFETESKSLLVIVFLNLMSLRGLYFSNHLFISAYFKIDW